MASYNQPHTDPFRLRRFIAPQKRDYETALQELKHGRKRTHWMWYIFPQFSGLGNSPVAKLYEIKSIAEAQAYLDHPILGPRLQECTAAILAIEGRTAAEIFPFPDNLKLRSCLTLFAHISPPGSPFTAALRKFYDGQLDEKTVQLIQ